MYVEHLACSGNSTRCNRQGMRLLDCDARWKGGLNDWQRFYADLEVGDFHHGDLQGLMLGKNLKSGALHGSTRHDLACALSPA